MVCDVPGLEGFAAANAAFLANARSDVPDLLADLREARAGAARATQEAEALKLAIRAFTVDLGTPDAPKPNGPAEEASLRLGEALLALPPPVGREIWRLAEIHSGADADRLRTLRMAAEAFFGEDFREAVRP